MAKEYTKKFYNKGNRINRDVSRKFYKSKEWRECRESYIPTVYGLCEKCGEPGYILDHIEEITPDNINDPNITLNHENLQFLCLPCHNKKTFKDGTVLNDGLMFDENGFVIKE